MPTTDLFDPGPVGSGSDMSREACAPRHAGALEWGRTQDSAPMTPAARKSMMEE
jgi:hypothetical protein